MSNTRFLTDAQLPFCKGCGHALVAQNTEKALQKLNVNPLDVVLVTDIGCHGIVDKSFLTHTVHGLHGRSSALAAGITAGLNNPGKKVIVFTGDGGATIGMQHLIGGAHLGFDMTVVVHNNMLYGMTGGQPSEFTPCGFKTPTLPEGSTKPGYDICELMVAAGASYVERVIGIGDYSDSLAKAFTAPGFSLVEVMEICPSYGVKSNPGMKLSKLVEDAGWNVKVYADGKGNSFKTPINSEPKSLISDKFEVKPKYSSSIERPVSIMLSGSAGEGVQSAAEFLAKAAIVSGLNSTKKGSYPVTVGVGFSASEVIVSPKQILYTGSPVPDVLIITSTDGLGYARAAAGRMKGGVIYIDETLDAPETGARIVKVPFRERVGAKNSAMYAVFYAVHYEKFYPIEALKDVFLSNKIAEKVNIESLLQF
ncbi:thiamine pyrophosphate-dependent enzyme [Tenuifilum sp.]|uniref:thiamine pyrophosphate-dependent enzyme n=1 Tax=Tenuifilum sp. TaxID=2760880 RepID=UPI002CCFA870|nr:thiamine pyrophosphate-dependent enzyme [Tenuifilum sp.]